MSQKDWPAGEDPDFWGPRPSRFVYGPVLSRRLGRSLGIDILPPKTCNLDCVYCQLGPTTKRVEQRRPYFRVTEILEAVKSKLASCPKPDYLTFSGSGEPTLNAHLGELIVKVKKIASLPVAVLTNGLLLSDKEVRRELKLADLVIPSLDAATSEVFALVNRPSPSVSLDTVIEGLIRFREEYAGEIWLEIMLVKQINDHPDHLKKLKEIIARLKPQKIQLNTVVRPPAESWALPLDIKELEEAQRILGAGTEIVTETRKRPIPTPTKSLPDSLLEVISRRPASAEELAATLGEDLDKVSLALSTLLANGQIKEKKHDWRVQYEIQRKRGKNA